MSEGEKTPRRGYQHPLFLEAQTLLDTYMDNFAEVREKTQISDVWGAVDDESAFSICDIVDRETATLTAQLADAQAKLKEQAMSYLALDMQATEAIERAVRAEKERDEALASAEKAEKRTPAYWIVGPRGWTHEEIFTNESEARRFAESEGGIVTPLYSYPFDAHLVRGDGAIAGWNACRRSIYAVCEDVGKEAEAAGKHGGEHARGYAAGMARAAKSIARGFCAMEAEHDDNLAAALKTGAPSHD